MSNPQTESVPSDTDFIFRHRAGWRLGAFTRKELESILQRSMREVII